MIEAGSDRYTLREAWEAISSRFRRKPEGIEPEILEPVPQATWFPRSELERTVYAALVLAGEPVNNRRLAELMLCSPGHASKCVAQLEGVIKKVRVGRQVFLSLPSPN